MNARPDNDILKSDAPSCLIIEEDQASALGMEATRGQIFCANCIHCKLVPSPAESEGLYRLRVRCDAGKWKKEAG